MEKQWRIDECEEGCEFFVFRFYDAAAGTVRHQHGPNPEHSLVQSLPVFLMASENAMEALTWVEGIHRRQAGESVTST